MPIKYGELTVIHNKEEMDIFTSFFIWLKYEIKTLNKSKLVFLFDDGEIYDSDDKLEDFKFYFFDDITLYPPKYFKKNIDTKIYINKDPIQKEDGKYVLSFKEIFSSYTKYNSSMNIASYYNIIYCCNKSFNTIQDIFGIMRIKSNESMPRFLFAYESDEFTKDEVIYIINYIFKNLNI